MRELVVGPFKSLIRIAAQVRKELIQVRRRPAAFFSLVLGPFVIMAVFGLGYTGVRQPLDAVIVVPADMALPREVAFYQDLSGPALAIRAVTDDPAAARAGLAAQQLDMVVIAPPDVAQRFRAGQQAEIIVEINSSTRSTRATPTSWPRCSTSTSTRRSSSAPWPRGKPMPWATCPTRREFRPR